MPRTLLYLLALLLAVLCAAPDTAQAQDDPPQEKTREASPAAPVTYVYGQGTTAAPDALTRVRHRIAEIGTRGATRRLITPIYIILPPGQAAPPPHQAPAFTPALPPTPGTTPAPGSQFTQEDLDRLEDNLARRFDDLDERLDDLQKATPTTEAAPSAVPVEEATPTTEAAPSAVQVESALLETGLFQTTAIIFEFDRSTLLPVSEKILDVMGDVLVRHPEVYIEVAGHTDSAGSEHYNRRLSEARASTVRAYLLDRFGLAPERIEARGYGEAQPVTSNATATGRALNRRVAFRVVNPEIARDRF